MKRSYETIKRKDLFEKILSVISIIGVFLFFPAILFDWVTVKDYHVGLIYLIVYGILILLFKIDEIYQSR